MPEKDLKLTGTQIMKQMISVFDYLDIDRKENLEDLIEVFSKAYYRYQEKQDDKLPHKNFHSLRDFYWMIKSFSILLDQNGIVDENLLKFVENAMDFNFSGIYTNDLKLKDLGDHDLNLEKYSSNNLMKMYFKKVYEEKFRNKKISKFKYNSSNSNVLDHITRAFKQTMGWFLLLFFDKTYTIEILLQHV